MAFLVLLESLSPVERAVFLLREVFDYDYQEIAQIVDKSEANCRQIFGRARKHLAAHRPRYEADTEHSEALLQSFLAAARDGDVGQLVDLLAADAVFCGDGGGKATAIAQPVYGREQVAAFFLAISERVRGLGVTFESVLVNGGPGLIARDPEGSTVSVLSVEVADGVIQTMRSVVNPDKLQHLGPVSDVLRLPGQDQDADTEVD
jgi:RNA polymerase sigma-70 factor (ECF subfamily)